MRVCRAGLVAWENSNTVLDICRRCCRGMPSIALGMERVMGIEPIVRSRKINAFDVSGQASAIQVRDFEVRGAVSGNLWQLTATAPKDPRPTTDLEYSLLQAHGIIELRELSIERTEWQIPDLPRDLQHEAV